MSKHRTLEEEGIACPRCGRPTQVRVHDQLSEKHTVRQPFYYSRWFYCAHADCKTRQIMCDEFRVYNGPGPGPDSGRLVGI